MSGAVGRAVRVGVTGHMDLGRKTVRLVAEALRRHLSDLASSGADVIGVSCLAPGADRIFARVLLELGGRLEVILPSVGYQDPVPGSFGALLSQASSVRTMQGSTALPQTYVDANDAMLECIDSLVAVWDGKRDPAKPGGTAHVVELALARRMQVVVIWPAGARRTCRR